MKFVENTVYFLKINLTPGLKLSGVLIKTEMKTKRVMYPKKQNRVLIIQENR